jgi:hypothetical protein
MSTEWSKWHLFPDPRQHGILVAPFGPGCYELRNGDQLVLYGRGVQVAYRMTSLLPGRWGSGRRNNQRKREYVFANLGQIEYRTLACATGDEAKAEERELQSERAKYMFPQ